MSVEEWRSKYNRATTSFFASESCHWFIGTKWIEIMFVAGVGLYWYGWHKTGVVFAILAGIQLIRREGIFEGYRDGFVNALDDPQEEWSEEDKKEWIPEIKRGIGNYTGIILNRSFIKKQKIIGRHGIPKKKIN